MTTWGLISEKTNAKDWDRDITLTRVVAYVEGTYEEALAELERHARNVMAHYPKKRKRRHLYRNGDDFLLIIDSSPWWSKRIRFTVAELLEDTAAPGKQTDSGDTTKSTDEEQDMSEPVEPRLPASRSEERYPDGVPVKPKWLGRPDLP
jgi:hypothetical protein